MTQFGTSHCNTLKGTTASSDTKLLATYYDAQWIYYQIGDYTRAPATWNSCADAAEKVYRDSYSLPNNGGVPGYWNFSHGATQDYLRTGDTESKRSLLLQCHNASYAPDTTPLAWTVDWSLSREVSYAIMAYLNAENLGEPRRTRLAAFVDQSFGHIDQWFVTNSAEYVKPFMVGLTAQALIEYYEHTQDSRVIPKLIVALDGLWNLTWVPAAQAFKYQSKVTPDGDDMPAPDLNLLIAPAYAWLYYQTGDVKYRDQADEIFVGGVNQAFVYSAKQFNQNYRWSFEYVRLRKLKPLK
jgi:hypothetical protein